MNEANKVKYFISSMLLSAVTLMAATPASAALSVSDVPLFLTSQADPNILYILDDSGSMQWELMPNGIMNNDNEVRTNYAFPVPAGVYGTSEYANTVPTFDGTDIFSVRARSPNNNSVYYNPALTYRPWAKADGTFYPDAVITCALHNPYNPPATPSALDDCRNLTVNNTETADWISKTAENNESRTFYPATYFAFTGADVNNPADYTKIEIQAANAPFNGSAARSDCAAAPSCTYAEEIQNFANWYTYYRSRVLTARAGTGFAFAEQGGNIRVGFGAINETNNSVDGATTDTLIRGVRTFSGTDRDNFFDDLYGHPMPTSGTPLRRALDDAGQYYSRSSNQGPWGKEPGVNNSADHFACRQSYTVLMTDGCWNSTEASTAGARANVDNSNGPSIAPPTGASYQYTPDHPYRDNYDNTLADVAMYYWNRDLRGIGNGPLDNIVPTNPKDNAFWQHMVSFTVGLGVNGTLDPVADWPGLQAGTTAWPDPNNPADTNNPLETIDDLWHAAVNGHGGFLSAANPAQFADALTATLADIASRTSSAAAVSTNSTRLDTNSAIYQARFNSEFWTGQLLSFAINPDGSVGTVQWDAATLIPAAASRNILTFVPGTGGATFEWANLTGTQQGYLNTDPVTSSADALGADRLNYLRGDATNEQKNGGVFRNRTTVLGDIINSDPAFVSTADFGFSVLTGNSGAEGTSYVTFRASPSYQTRTPMLYVGGNDGMLHAFDADTGVEKFAFVPNEAYPKLNELTTPAYSHTYFVDAPARAGDAYLSNAWKSVLLGATGAGGKAVFALDITTPGSFGASNVMWEFTHAELGVTIGQPSFARVNAGDKWIAIFGNGYNSTSHKAQLFVVDLETGALLKVIDTGVGSSTEPNGLATPIPVDVDGDRVTDYIYAGDLHGNMWKFDFTGASVASWSSAFTSGMTPQPLYTACDADPCTGTALRQPITTRPDVGLHPDGGLMVYFGTGKYFETTDNIVTPPNPLQSFYGIRDQATQVGGRNDLQPQTIILEQDAVTSGTEFDIRVVSDTTIDYTTEDGWYLDLISPSAVDGAGERVVSSPILRNGRVIFTTIIPSADACTFGGTSWLMELDAVSGARLTYSVFDVNGDGLVNDADFVTLPDGTKVPVSGRKMPGIVTEPGIISAGEIEYKYSSTSSGAIIVTTEAGGGTEFGRQSWRQLK